MNWALLKNSFAVAAGATALALLLGFCAAVCLVSSRPSIRATILVGSICAFALPPFLVTNCWLHLLGFTGIWHSWLPWNIYSLSGTVWILALLTWPVTTWLVAASLAKVERAQFEYDPALQGVTLVRHLLVPFLRPALVASAVITFVLALNNFAVPALLQVKVYSAEVWVDFNTKFDVPRAAALSWPLVCAPLALMLILRSRSFPWPHLEPSVDPALLRRRLGPVLTSFIAVLTTVVLLLSLLLPLTQLGLEPSTWSQVTGAFAAGHGAIKSSLLIGVSVATSCLLLAILGEGRKAFEIPLWILFLIPGVILGITLIQALNRPATAFFYQSLGIVIFALTLRYLAVAWSLAQRAFASSDPELEGAARSLGAGAWQRFRHVQWPQVRGPLAAAWYATYLLALWDVETLILVVPPGGETISLRIFNLLHYGHATQVNALCLILLAAALIPLALYGLFRIAKPLRVGLLAVALAGCSESPDHTTVLKSRLFSNVQIIGSRGTGPGQFNKPRSLTLDRKGNLYVVDMTGRVQKFSPEGAFLSYWQMPQTDKGKPKGMALDKDGHIVVVEPHYSRVNHFDEQGRLLRQWGTNGLNPGQLFFPRAIAFSSVGNAYVTEYGMIERIQCFSPGGTNFIGSFGKTGTEPGQLNRAEGLGIDAKDNVYAADSCNHRIQVFSPEGKFLRAYGKAGNNPGELSYPYDVRIDAGGLQFVCEFGNSRIQVFDSKDQLVEVIGGVGLEPGEFNNPWSIALDPQGNLYVADAGNHRVQKLIRRRS